MVRINVTGLVALLIIPTAIQTIAGEQLYEFCANLLPCMYTVLAQVCTGCQFAISVLGF